MGCLGVHFAVEAGVVEQLTTAIDDAAKMAIIEAIEEAWDREWLHDNDKSWDALHRSLTDGKLEWESGAYPLSHAVLGGIKLYDGDDYIICLVRHSEVGDVATALQSVTRESLRRGYDLIPADAYLELGDEDFEYTWESFQGLPDLFSRAATAGRAVIFTASQ
ncbi:MAG: YfbM family protein [Planctomycetota bacterium]